MSEAKKTRHQLGEADQAALDKLIDNIAVQVSKHLKPIADLGAEAEKLVQPLGDVATDFRPLLKVLAKISAEHCQTSDQQRAVFERALLEYELDPSEYDWVMTADALSVLVGYADAIEGRDWTPGREDLAPLFDLDELTAS